MNVPITMEAPDFAGLVARQSQFALRVAWTILRNSHDVEDVVQETFLKLYRNGSWKRMEDEKAFLARVVWRMAVDKLQARKRDNIPAGEEISPENPEQAAIALDWKTTVHRMMDALPEELRQPLALSSIDELNSREIADVMGISEGTVRTRIMRARQLLKQKLAVLEGEPSGRP